MKLNTLIHRVLTRPLIRRSSALLIALGAWYHYSGTTMYQHQWYAPVFWYGTAPIPANAPEAFMIRVHMTRADARMFADHDMYIHLSSDEWVQRGCPRLTHHHLCLPTTVSVLDYSPVYTTA